MNEDSATAASHVTSGTDFWESLGPTGPGCPFCKELLIDDACPCCDYRIPDKNASWQERELFKRHLMMTSAANRMWTKKLLNVVEVPVFFGLVIFFWGSLSVIPPAKGDRTLDLAGRIGQYWDIFGWIPVVALYAVALCLPLYGLHYLMTARYRTSEYRAQIEQLRQQLIMKSSPCIMLYTMPLSVERLGPPGEVQAKHLLDNSPRSQAKLFEVTHASKDGKGNNTSQA